MLTRILNNNPGARSLENVKAQALVVLDTPATGWLMASPGGWECGVSTQILCTEISRNPEDHILCEYESGKGLSEQFVVVDFLPSSFSCSVTDGTFIVLQPC